MWVSFKPLSSPEVDRFKATSETIILGYERDLDIFYVRMWFSWSLQNDNILGLCIPFSSEDAKCIPASAVMSIFNQ